MRRRRASFCARSSGYGGNRKSEAGNQKSEFAQPSSVQPLRFAHWLDTSPARKTGDCAYLSQLVFHSLVKAQLRHGFSSPVYGGRGRRRATADGGGCEGLSSV